MRLHGELLLFWMLLSGKHVTAIGQVALYSPPGDKGRRAAATDNGPGGCEVETPRGNPGSVLANLRHPIASRTRKCRSRARSSKREEDVRAHPGAEYPD